MKKTAQYKDGNSLSYTEVGNPNGYPVLVQHGMIASITDQELFEGLVNRGARVISMARPGYGESSPYLMKNIGEWGEIVAVLVEKLELSQFDVLGISSGAPYSYALGHQFPDRVRDIYILNGIPALYDANVVSFWPYPVEPNASMDEMQALAYELFFSHLSPEDLKREDIRDSLRNNCFGVAQDLRIRGMDWGFQLRDVKVWVTMRHNRSENLKTAELTAALLPNCRLILQESDVHFSKDVIDDFILTVMTGNYKL